VIALDTNVLVYAHRVEAPFHERAKDAIVELATGRASWAIPWPCVHEFLGNVTNPRIYKTPTPVERALAQVEQWLGAPTVVLLCEDAGYWQTLRDLVVRSKVAGAKVHDARVAALCLRHGVSELWTADRDFSRFGELCAKNPFVA
jgi:toxin-antitoxin system PIN domain toxin